MLRLKYDHKIRKIAEKLPTNRATDHRIHGWPVRANLVAARLMVMFRTQDPQLQISRGCKQLVHDPATSRAGRYHQLHMMVVWQVTWLVWQLTGRPCDWSCHLWNSFTTGSMIYYDQFSDNWLHLILVVQLAAIADGSILKGLGFKITLDIFVIIDCLKFILETTVSCQVWLNLRPSSYNFIVIHVWRVLGYMLLISEFVKI